MIVFHNLLRRAAYLRCSRRMYSQKPAAARKRVDEKDEPSLVRNIGILAHIDAGKTTTTERMLFFSGTIDNMGEVHHGNTVTDFMEQERQRGITIQSASVTFPWDKHTINLLDTPGHIDFTMEVEQTLNVMDGAVVVLDGTAGVEAQTLTVWRQAERYRIPRLIYINKMDRPDAGFFQSLQTVEAKLNVTPVVLQIPFFTESKVFCGVVDLINMVCYNWKDAPQGVNYQRKKLSQEDGRIWESACKGRIRLTETLADLDDRLAENIISEKESIEGMSADSIKTSVRKVTENLIGVPILCGSSYKNIGVQLLMDAIVQYLPSPVSNKSSVIFQCFQNNLCARAFKVRHDPEKGPVTFFRIYSGSLSKGQKIFNMRLWKPETCKRVMIAYADDYEEQECIGTGNIAAVTGLQATRVGDLVTSSSAVLNDAKKLLESKRNVKINEDLNDVFAVGALIPDPVFFCSIEPPSSIYQKDLDRALAQLAHEDPSLRVNINQETGQTVLAGMGELHLEVVKQRIKQEYKVEVDTGPLQIAYKEKLIKSLRESHSVDRTIGKSTHSVRVSMSVLAQEGTPGELLLLDKSPECIPNISVIFPKHLVAVKHGVESAVLSGPKLFSPVVNIQVMLHMLDVGRGTADSMITSATAQCVKKLIKIAGTRLLEPLMFVEVVCPADLMPLVLADIGKRRALIQKTDMRGTDRVLEALVPLSELLGYAHDLRVITSGQASFTMEFRKYSEMTPEAEAEAVKKVTGFYPRL
ncbi:UNVERIFIED_CONTAM: hypothetical protein PYX00_007722 [Menopon gallinae]|uniref:Tr-type G domain-containing protein n=1 Tax=Menopon gallinae TaxID=328185 RepID=A0AAW2HLF0_9NEOP